MFSCHSHYLRITHPKQCYLRYVIFLFLIIFVETWLFKLGNVLCLKNSVLNIFKYVLLSFSTYQNTFNLFDLDNGFKRERKFCFVLLRRSGTQSDTPTVTEDTYTKGTPVVTYEGHTSLIPTLPPFHVSSDVVLFWVRVLRNQSTGFCKKKEQYC